MNYSRSLRALSTALTKSCTLNSAAFWHLQRPLQQFLQPHRNRSMQASDASGMIVQVIHHPSPGFLFQPRHLVTEGLNQTVSLPITDPIKRNNLYLFGRPQVRQKSTKQLQMSFLKSEERLFSIPQAVYCLPDTTW